MTLRNASLNRGKSIVSVMAWPLAAKTITQLVAVLSTELACGEFFKFNGARAVIIPAVIFFTHSFDIVPSCPLIQAVFYYVHFRFVFWR
jgi:hypothetical protein